jgi:hypothetical protein
LPIPQASVTMSGITKSAVCYIHPFDIISVSRQSFSLERLTMVEPTATEMAKLRSSLTETVMAVMHSDI